MNQHTHTVLLEAKLKKIFTAFKLTQIKFSQEANEYEACSFKINESNIVYRKAKITPKKIGRFVAIWRRTAEGITAPYADSGAIDFLVINVGTRDKQGLFIIPKTALIKHQIIGKNGKRGMRVYPPWSNPENKQAIKTQKWQIEFFHGTFQSSLLQF